VRLECLNMQIKLSELYANLPPAEEG